MSESDFDSAPYDEHGRIFKFAREALSLVRSFGTPPTPEVYEVWYRYVEGNVAPVTEQLDHAINEAKSISTARLLEIRRQFLSSSETTEVNAQVSQKLASEIGLLQSIIKSQVEANQQFGGVVESANVRLANEAVSQNEQRQCLSKLLVDSESIVAQMEVSTKKLESSKEQIEALCSKVEELQKELFTDPLTGVGNRRAYEHHLANAVLLRDELEAFFLILVDLDKFKEINDCHGHATGDEVLRFIASQSKKHFGSGTVCRYGGDEFAIFITLEPAESIELCNEYCRLFQSIDLTVRRTGEQLGSLTVSLGAAILRADDSSSTWFERADKLLYSAKAGGRNRAMVERTVLGKAM